MRRNILLGVILLVLAGCSEPPQEVSLITDCPEALPATTIHHSHMIEIPEGTMTLFWTHEGEPKQYTFPYDDILIEEIHAMCRGERPRAEDA